jgi:hypothetical protein
MTAIQPAEFRPVTRRTCPHCGHDRAIGSNGLLRTHDYATADGTTTGAVCPGTGWPPALRRRLTELEHTAAWHAIEGAAGEDDADPGTVLNAVLRALDIDPPA